MPLIAAMDQPQLTQDVQQLQLVAAIAEVLSDMWQIHSRVV
jgi:hypothetical protein